MNKTIEKMSKSVVFILPEYVEIPMGGYKVVFEYSNRFVSDGFEVTIIYPSFLFFSKSSFKRKLKMCFFYLYYLIFKRQGVRKWFPLDENVKEKFVFSLKEKYLPKSGKYFATAMETAICLDGFKNIHPKDKYYLIQGIEDWKWGLDAFLDTWNLDLNKIVVSPWLRDYVETEGGKSILIENGVDRPKLKLENSIEKRDKFKVMMLYHKQKLKGAEDGFKALEIVREKYPELKSVWFGCPSKPTNLPDWIDYYQEPEESKLNELYNESSIYLGPSQSEGFGLTIGEAMTCGCAVVCTDAGGYLTMATDGETALISKIGDVKTMAENIIRLINDEMLRITLSKKGHENILRFTWDSAYGKLIQVLN